MRLSSFIFTLPIATSLALQLSAQIYEFTGNGDTNGWSDNQNWKQGAQDPANDFPDDGAEASIPAISGLLNATLAKEITLSSLNLSPNQQFSLNLDGNALNVTGQLREFGATSILRDGTLNVSNLDAGDLRLVNTTFNLEGGIIYGGGLQLWSGTTLNLSGQLDITGTGLASGDADATFRNIGGNIRSDNTNATITLGLPYEQDAGTLNVTLGTLALTSTATLTSGSVRAEGADAAIQFQGPTQLNSTPLTTRSGGAITFSSTLTANQFSTSSDDFGTVAISAANGETFSVDEFIGASEAPVTLNSGIQAENTSTLNSGNFIWSGGTLRNLSNEGNLQIESSGASTSPRILQGTLFNRDLIRLGGAVTLQSPSTLQNEEGATLRTGSGSLTPASGALEQTGFANLGTLETFNAQTNATFATRIINQGAIHISQGSLSFTGPSELEGLVVLQPQDFSQAYAATLSVGGDNDIAHRLNNLTFTAAPPIGENGTAQAVFGRGSYTLSGIISSLANGSADRSSVRFQRGTWTPDTGASLDFAQGLPLELGEENLSPLFQLPHALTNTGHLQITRATITGPASFTNNGTISSQRLEIGDAGASGSFRNQQNFTLVGGSAPLLAIGPSSRFENNGENALLTLSDNATISSPLEASEATLLNSGQIQTAAPSRGKIIAAPFRQAGSADASIHATQDNGNLSFQRPAEIAEGLLRSESLVTFADSVQWGASQTPAIEFQNNGAVAFSANAKTFTLLDNLVASGNGEFRLTLGSLAPTPTATRDLNLSGLSKLAVSGGTLGVSTATLRNFGNIEQSSGTLAGSFINAGNYTLSGGDFDNAAYTNLSALHWQGGSISGTLENADAPSAELHITGNGTLKANATLTNHATVLHHGNTRLQNNATLTLAAGSYRLTDSGSLTKESSDVAGTSLQVQENARLIATREQASNPTANVSINTFMLNEGEVATERTFSNLSLTADQLQLNGGAITLSDFSAITFTGALNGEATLDRITIGDTATLTLQDRNNAPHNLRAKNTNLRGTLKANLIQKGPLDSFSPNAPLAASTIEGDLTQETDQTLSTVVRADENGATTLQVANNATLAGPLVLVIDEDYQGSVIPVLNANAITGQWDETPTIISPAPGLSGTISYPNANSAVVTLTRDPEAGPATRNYRHYVYTHFDPAQRADPSIWAPTADPDGDGVTNLQSFLQNDDPTDGIQPPPLIGNIQLHQSCQSCDNPETFLRFRLDIEDDFSGVNIRLRSLADPADPGDDLLSPPIRWTNPEAPGDYYLQIPVAPTATESDLYDLELSIQDGETVL